jgi:hypothetical protein
MRDNILIAMLFLGCAFSLGVMAAGGLLPSSVMWIIAGGAVLVAVAVVFVAGLLGVVYLFKRHETPRQAAPWHTCRPYPDRPTWTPVDHQGAGYRIDHRPVDHHVDPWPTLGPAEDPRRELPTPERSMIRWTRNR